MIKVRYLVRYPTVLSCVLHGLLLLYLSTSLHLGGRRVPEDRLVISQPVDVAITEETQVPAQGGERDAQPKLRPLGSKSPVKRESERVKSYPAVTPEQGRVRKESTGLDEAVRKVAKEATVDAGSEKPKPRETRDRKTIQDLLSKIPDLHKESPGVQRSGLRAKGATTKPGRRMTISELDALRGQIERCWDIPVSLRDVDKAAIVLHVSLNRDGTLMRRPQVMEPREHSSSPASSVLARSAVRAVERCQPFRLPKEKYETWKELDVVFNLEDMF